LTGPRKRTYQLFTVCCFGLFLTTGGPAHSARSRRHSHGYGTRTRRNYSTSNKRARTKSKHDRHERSARFQRANSLAQRAAWLKQRSTQPNEVSTLWASRGLTTSITDRRSASDLSAALARRRAWMGGAPMAPDPSATGNADGGPSTGTDPPADEGLEPADAGGADGWGEGEAKAAELSPAERRQEAVIRDALEARGIRYRWGGASRGGFDCSGFTRYVMARNMGIKLPHSAHAQAHYGQKVAIDDLKQGDLVFFSTYRRGISHVGIYIGDNQFIHAPRTGRTVAIDSLTGYYRHRYVTARRLSGASPPLGAAPSG
jgi:cell wall-associated NlpC family hydrolase